MEPCTTCWQTMGRHLHRILFQVINGSNNNHIIINKLSIAKERASRRQCNANLGPCFRQAGSLGRNQGAP